MIKRFIDLANRVKGAGEMPRYDSVIPQGLWPWSHGPEKLKDLLDAIRNNRRNEENSVGLTVYYEYIDFGRFKGRLITAILGGIGLVMFVVPSIEVFLLVLRSVGKK